VNIAPESYGLVVEGEAPEVDHVEETPTVEGKHHAHFTYFYEYLIVIVA
jgi:hypothetical protein